MPFVGSSRLDVRALFSLILRPADVPAALSDPAERPKMISRDRLWLIQDQIDVKSSTSYHPYSKDLASQHAWVWTRISRRALLWCVQINIIHNLTHQIIFLRLSLSFPSVLFCLQSLSASAAFRETFRRLKKTDRNCIVFHFFPQRIHNSHKKHQNVQY